MTPVYIHVFILRPGFLMDASKRPADEPRPSPDIIMAGDKEHDGFARVENDARVIYSVERKERLKDRWRKPGFTSHETALEQIQIDLFGRLAETLLCIESVTELPDAALLDASRSDPFWLHSTLSESGWDLMSDEDFQEIFEQAEKMIAHEAAEIEGAFLKDGREFEGSPNHEQLKRELAEQREFVVSWPCFMTAHVSRGGLEEGPELEAINYAGAATLVKADVAAQITAGDLAHEAVDHVLRAVCDDARKFYLMGHGTGSREKLIAAWRAKHGKTEDEADQFWQFYDPKRFERHVKELELSEKLLCAFREGKIGMPEHEALSVGFGEQDARRLAEIHEKNR